MKALNVLSSHPGRSSVAVLAMLAALGGCASAKADASKGGALQAQPAAASGDVSGLVASVQPAVVNITVEQVVKARSMPDVGGDSPFDQFFREFGGSGRNGKIVPMPREGKRVGAGSGFIIDDRHVVTNAHVVDGADTVKVKLSDERELEAKVLGKDPRLDIAVLEVKGAKNLPHVALGASSTLKVGEPVVAIGNPFGLGGTVTKGIVSAKSRAIGAGPYDDFIQTDASINPGNSGGPLFDMRGQVVGMNTAINPNGQGIGFAIPADAIKNVLPQLIERGHVTRGKLGAHIQEVDEPLAKALGLASTRGALVGDVEKGSAGERAGLHDGDVITAVDGTPVPHAHDLPRMIAGHAPGSKVALEVHRGTETKTITTTLDELEDDQPRAAQSGEAAPPAGPLGIEIGQGRNGGAVVQGVSPSGPAAGRLAPGDVIVEVDRQPVSSAADAAAKLRASPAGKPILLRVEREGASRYVAIDRAPG